ncbi:MAG: hypothetical protein WCV00_12020 [Verrucomicrobiia bacterium]
MSENTAILLQMAGMPANALLTSKVFEVNGVVELLGGDFAGNAKLTPTV